MCTVTYIWSNGKAIITSNRDEHVDRPASLPPQQYVVNGKKVIFPRDPKAGGTWFVVDEEANSAVLLNGAANRHIPRADYVKSRGLILLDIISGSSPLETWNTCNLDGIEPFTIILWQQGNLYQLRWDFDKKETIQLNPEQNHIWSSSTIYSAETKKEREKWLLDFLTRKEEIDARDMKYFHTNAGNGNDENGLVINRNDIMMTFSITQAIIAHGKAELFHYDLLEEASLSTNF